MSLKNLLTRLIREETEAIHKTAQEFWRMVRLYLSDKDPQIKLFEEI
jgi:hypothetical protein